MKHYGKNEEGNLKQIHKDSTYQPNQKMYGLKPYIYYSCRYIPKNIDNSDFTITYSLDNYITIQGMLKGMRVNKSGYLIDPDEVDTIKGDPTQGYLSVRYRGVDIVGENTQNLRENVGNDYYYYVKINGVKNYYDDNTGSANYYAKAQKFTNWVRQNLQNLEYEDAVDAYGRPFEIGDSEDTDDKNYTQNGGLVGDTKIFGDCSDIEYPDSNFNQHRLAVIRNAIESNLSVAIANYNNYTNVKTNFLMPNLAEDEWDLVLNNTCVISFLQGMSIGGKIYNGYSIVPNNKNKEVVTEDSIYITTGDESNGEYHRVGENGLSNNASNAFFNIDFEPQLIVNTDGTKGYYYPHKHTGSYTSIITQTDINDYENIYAYLADKPTLAQKYYTALGRERYGMYRSNYDVYISSDKDI